MRAERAAALHRAIAWPYLAAIGVPLSILAVAGWLNLRLIEEEAFRRVSRTTQALTEHALRTFRTHELIIASVERNVEGWTWERILSSSELNRLLVRLASSAPDVASVFLLHPDGRRFNSSRRFPMPPIDASDRDYYRALRERDGLVVSEPALGRLSQDRFFTIARRRPAADGEFDGLIAVSVAPSYFEAFFSGMMETGGDWAALVRADGAVLARYPAVDGGTRVNTQLFRAQPRGGVARVDSTLDGEERLYSFQPVGDYGVYASYNLSASAVWAAWRRAMAPYALATILGMVALVVFARRRESEHAARARRVEEERLERWTDAVPTLVSYIDKDLHYRFNNRAYEDWFGKTRQEMRGRHVAEVLGPEAYEKLRPHFEAALAGRSTTYEALAPYRDGGPRHIQGTYIPDIGPDGSVHGMFVLVLDITARKEAELALAEAGRAKDEFLATLAHELRNPLAPITTALSLMRRLPPGAPAALEAHAILERQAAHLARLVDDLLDVGRIARGRLELRTARLEAAPLVHQAVETCRPQLDQAGHRLEVRLPEAPLHVEVDAVRMVQALGNLLNNAARYTPPRGRIEVAVERRGQSVAFTVRDNGVGMEPGLLVRAFDMFARGSTSPELSASRGEGLGIGLSLARRIAELHGGSLEAKSEGPGKGSEFTLALPLARASAGDAPADATARGPALAAEPRRVLVVDDNRDAAMSLAALLRASGHETEVAHDGQAGVEATARYRPDVVLLDIGMPKLNGYDACRAIRAQAGGRGVRIIALTGWGQEQDLRRSREAGFDLHLVKPVDAGRLEQALRSA